jgi:hypothetical protein
MKTFSLLLFHYSRLAYSNFNRLLKVKIDEIDFDKFSER